jgi:hypothetical protein
MQDDPCGCRWWKNGVNLGVAAREVTMAVWRGARHLAAPLDADLHRVS